MTGRHGYISPGIKYVRAFSKFQGEDKLGGHYFICKKNSAQQFKEATMNVKTQSQDIYQTSCLYGWGLRFRLKKALISACFLATHGHPTPEPCACCWSATTVCRQSMSETQPQLVWEHASVSLFNCRIESFEPQTKIHNMFKLEGLGQRVNGKTQAAFSAVLCGHWILPREAVSWWASKPRTAYALIWNGNQGDASPRETTAADPDCWKWDKFLLLATWRVNVFTIAHIHTRRDMTPLLPQWDHQCSSFLL